MFEPRSPEVKDRRRSSRLVIESNSRIETAKVTGLLAYPPCASPNDSFHALNGSNSIFSCSDTDTAAMERLYASAGQFVGSYAFLSRVSSLHQ